MASVTKEQVVEFLENLTLLQAAELVKELEEKFGVSAAAPMAMMAAPAAAAGVGCKARCWHQPHQTSLGTSLR